MKTQAFSGDAKETEVWFDFDGTLVDSAMGVMRSLQEAFVHCGLDSPPIAASMVVGPPLAEVILAIAPGETGEKHEKIAAAFRAAYDAHGCESTFPFLGCSELLGKVFACDTKLRILTNKRQRPLERIVRHLGWTHFFAGLHGVDQELSRGIALPKPDRAALIHAGNNRTRVYVVGDGLDDLHAAERIGARFFLAGWGYGTARVLAERPSVTVLNQPSDLLALLQAEGLVG